MPITIKSAREIELMTEAGRILEIVHDELAKALHPGMSTMDIDQLGEEVIRSYGLSLIHISSASKSSLSSRRSSMIRLTR